MDYGGGDGLFTWCKRCKQYYLDYLHTHSPTEIYTFYTMGEGGAGAYKLTSTIFTPFTLGVAGGLPTNTLPDLQRIYTFYTFYTRRGGSPDTDINSFYTL